MRAEFLRSAGGLLGRGGVALGGFVHFHHGGITFLVDRLAKRSLVERRACPSDRRARYASLTADGEKLMKSIFPVHATKVREAMSGLTGVSQRELTELLRTLGVEAERLASQTPACKAAMAEPTL